MMCVYCLRQILEQETFEQSNFIFCFPTVLVLYYYFCSVKPPQKTTFFNYSFFRGKIHTVCFVFFPQIYSGEPVSHVPMEDAIFEEPRNVSAKLHRRVAK